jgi:hypothetical protein
MSPTIGRFQGKTATKVKPAGKMKKTQTELLSHRPDHEIV